MRILSFWGWTKAFSLSGILFALAAPIHAGTIFSNVGPGFPGDSNGFVVGNTGSPDGGFLGTNFVATGSGNLDTLSLDVQAATGPISVGLYANSAGQPGTLLESWSVAIPIGIGFPPIPSLTTLASVGHPLLSSGTEYWVVLSTSDNWWKFLERHRCWVVESVLHWFREPRCHFDVRHCCPRTSQYFVDRDGALSVYDLEARTRVGQLMAPLATTSTRFCVFC
jgi:hypothetical protein